jgi:hypothetical protein
MTMPAKITDHAAQAVGNLLSQFRNSARLQELISIFCAEIQSLENLYHELYDECTLDTAVGAQLDIEGEIVGWPRMGLSDDDYRAMIKVAIVINQTDGDIPTGTYIISQIVGLPVRYIQKGQAHAEFQWINSVALPQTKIDLLNSVMEKIVPSGVSWSLVEGIDDEVDPAKQFDTTGAGFDEGRFARRIDVL